MGINWDTPWTIKREKSDTISNFVANSHQTSKFFSDFKQVLSPQAFEPLVSSFFLYHFDTCNYEFCTVTKAQLSELCFSCLTELIYGRELINRLLMNFFFSFLLFFIWVLRASFPYCANSRAILIYIRRFIILTDDLIV